MQQLFSTVVGITIAFVVVIEIKFNEFAGAILKFCIRLMIGILKRNVNFFMTCFSFLVNFYY